MNKNKIFKSIIFSNLGLLFYYIILLLFIFLLRLTGLMKILFESQIYTASTGLMNFISGSIIIFILIIIYIKFKKIKYLSLVKYFLDIFFSFLMFLLILFPFELNKIYLLLSYFLFSLIIAFIFYYFKNIRGKLK